MKRFSVASSNVAEVGWERGPSPWTGTLEVKFVSGSVYQYSGVSARTAGRVISGWPSGSVGAALHRLIKSAAVPYPYKRVA